MRRVRLAACALAAAAVAGCGTTVQPDALPAVGGTAAGDGLTAEPPTSTGVPPAGGVPDAGTAAGPSGGGEPVAPGQPPVDDAPQAAAPDADPDAGGGAAPAVPGAGADRSPLRIGIVTTNNDAASSVGVVNGHTFTPRRAAEALVAATNAKGGLAGRRLVPTYAEIRSSSSNYPGDLQAICAQLVEDAKVALVLSFLGLADEQFASCLAKARLPHVNAAYGLGDVESQRSQPTTVSTEALTVDRRTAAQLTRLTAARHLTRSSRIGVLVEGCPFNVRSVSRTLRPTARRLGLQLVRVVETRCFEGVDDLSGLASDAQAAVLPFVQDRVAKVLVVSSAEANVLLFFMTAAESQGYRPGYALTSLALANVLQQNVPERQLAGVKALGWLPVMDDSGPPTPTAATRACIDTLRSRGLTPASPVDRFTGFQICDALGLTGRVLEQTRGATGARAFSAGLDRVGTSFTGAAMLEGRTDFRSGRRDGPAVARVFGWVSSCSCFRYSGSSGAL